MSYTTPSPYTANAISTFRRVFGTINKNGSEDATYGNIESNTTLNISGAGRVTINGTVGSCVVINKSGSGDLIVNGAILHSVGIVKSGAGNMYINGEVYETVRFSISGSGNTIFAEKLPDRVLSNIIKSGAGNLIFCDSQRQLEERNQRYQSTIVSGISIISSGGVVRVTRDGVTTVYSGNSAHLVNGELFIDNEPATRQRVLQRIPTINPDLTVVPQEPPIVPSWTMLERSQQAVLLYRSYPFADREQRGAPEPSSSSSQQPQQDSLISDTIGFLKKCSKHMRDYVESATQGPSVSDIIKELKLTEQEEPLFEKFTDHIFT